MNRSCKYQSLDKYLTNSDIDLLRKSLLNWFKRDGRHWIPWKLKANGELADPGELLDPYPIWIAEVMLQQTKLGVVLPYWRKWMQVFPTLDALCRADEEDILMLWQGLGYYSRAKRIHQSSKLLMELIGIENSSDLTYWPIDLETWMSLPGIGRTTAGSILSSAFDLPISILDGNLKRVFSRMLASFQPPAKDRVRLWQFSGKLIQSKSPRNVNQALMDLGNSVCTFRNPKCKFCPWKGFCLAYSSSDPKMFPVQEKREPIPFHVIGIGIVLNEGKVLIDKRLNGGSLGGMWEFPGGKQHLGEDIKLTIEREVMEELAIKVDVSEHLISINHSYSHKNLRFIVHICQWIDGEPQPLASQEVRWVEPDQLCNYPFPAANSKIITALINYLKEDRLRKPD